MQPRHVATFLIFVGLRLHHSPKLLTDNPDRGHLDLTMDEFKLLSVEEFRRLSAANQRQYLNRCAEHLAEVVRIHAEMTQPQVVPKPDTSNNGTR